METVRGFDLVLRGYDRSEVDAVVATVTRALESNDPVVRASAAAIVREAAFAMRLRGYHREQVEAFVVEARSALSDH